MNKKVILTDFNEGKSKIYVLQEPLFYDALAHSVLTFKDNLDNLEKEFQNSNSQNNMFYSDILKTEIQRFVCDSTPEKHRLFISSLGFSDEIEFNNGVINCNEKSTLKSQSIFDKISDTILVKYYSSDLYEAIQNRIKISNEVSQNNSIRQKHR